MSGNGKNGKAVKHILVFESDDRVGALCGAEGFVTYTTPEYATCKKCIEKQRKIYI